MVLDIIIMAVY